MNYYTPYFNLYPTFNATSRGLFRGINFSSILSNTQKALGIVNQAIPMVKQVTPMIRNAKTMFKVMNEFKKVDTPNLEGKNITNDKSIDNNVSNNNLDGGPTFFI